MCSKKIFYRAKKTDGIWTGWKNPGFEILMKHYSNRLSCNAKLYTVYEQVGRLLHYAYLRDHDNKEKMEQSQEYQLAQRYFYDSFKKEYPGTEVKEIQFFYFLEYLPEPGGSEKRKYEVMLFPSVKL